MTARSARTRPISQAGGVYNGSAGTLTVNNSVLTGNTASTLSEGYGGAIGNNATLSLNRSTSPYFTPDAGTLLTTRPPGSTSSTDTGAAGTAGVSATYIQEEWHHDSPEAI